MTKNKSLIKIAKLQKAFLYEEPNSFTSDQFFEIAGSKKLQSDLNKLNDFLQDLNNRNLDANTRRLIMQTKLKIKMVEKELGKVTTTFF